MARQKKSQTKSVSVAHTVSPRLAMTNTSPFDKLPRANQFPLINIEYQMAIALMAYNKRKHAASALKTYSKTLKAYLADMDLTFHQVKLIQVYGGTVLQCDKLLTELYHQHHHLLPKHYHEQSVSDTNSDYQSLRQKFQSVSQSKDKTRFFTFLCYFAAIIMTQNDAKAAKLLGLSPQDLCDTLQNSRYNANEIRNTFQLITGRPQPEPLNHDETFLDPEYRSRSLLIESAMPGTVRIPELIEFDENSSKDMEMDASMGLKEFQELMTDPLFTEDEGDHSELTTPTTIAISPSIFTEVVEEEKVSTQCYQSTRLGLFNTVQKDTDYFDLTLSNQYKYDA